jgi:high-affinity iron transporter
MSGMSRVIVGGSRGMWSDAVPNLLIGLREGLEAGLIVSILVATVVRAGRRDQLAPLWMGVACAVALSLAAGAVLTFGAADLPTSTQEAIAGALSLIAVGFVTWMVFWMRRSARDLSSQLRSRTELALTIGPQVLLFTAFVAVAREGLETALFLWSTTRTAGESAGPRLGAATGLTIAVVLCWALYRRTLHMNLTRFFTWTGAALILVAAGVLAYGVADLQGADVLPGAGSTAFDLSGQVDPASWYARLTEGIFNLTASMTVLQVAAYVGYLIPALGLFLWSTRAASAKAADVVSPRASDAARDTEAEREAPPAAVAVASTLHGGAAGEGELASPETGPVAIGSRSRRTNRFVLAGAAVAATSVLVAVVIITRVGPKAEPVSTIEITETACAPGWKAPTSGTQSFAVHNAGSQPAEIYLLAGDRTRAFAEIEGLAPGTTRTLAVTIGAGTYVWRCVPLGGSETFSAPLI